MTYAAPKYSATVKLEALKHYLEQEEGATPEELETLTAENAYNENYNTFEAFGNEYKVLTDEEADEAAKENIVNDLWAFNADFILKYTEFYNTSTEREDAEFIKALRELQSRLCESANTIVKALIVDLDEFVSDAIDADGRGHFLSYYDGEEHETQFNNIFVYRTN